MSLSLGVAAVSSGPSATTEQGTSILSELTTISTDVVVTGTEKSERRLVCFGPGGASSQMNRPLIRRPYKERPHRGRYGLISSTMKRLDGGKGGWGPGRSYDWHINTDPKIRRP